MSKLFVFLLGLAVGAIAMRFVDVRSSRKKKKKKISIDTFSKAAVVVVMAHGMILTTWSYILASHYMDPVVDVSSTIVREIVAPVIVYLATNMVMNIFEKNKLSFSVPLNSTFVKNGESASNSQTDDLAKG